MRLMALIEHPTVIQRILGHLGLAIEIPEPRPARAPPISLDARHLRVDDDDDVAAIDPCS